MMQLRFITSGVLASVLLVSCDSPDASASVQSEPQEIASLSPPAKLASLMGMINNADSAKNFAPLVEKYAKALPTSLAHQEALDIVNEMFRLTNAEFYGVMELAQAVSLIKIQHTEYSADAPLEVDAYEPSGVEN